MHVLNTSSDLQSRSYPLILGCFKILGALKTCIRREKAILLW